MVEYKINKYSMLGECKMSKLVDLTGKKFNMLTVISRAENTKEGITRWVCLCDCGNTTIVRGHNLKSNAVKSCGCLTHVPRYTHGLSNTRLYRIWNAMKCRCNLPTNNNYKNYGGRGIKICKEWNDNFLSFYDWAMANGYSENLTIERLNNDGNYEPDNCRWATKKEQANNRRYCVMITYNGKTQNLTQWCKELNLDYKFIHNRIKKNKWDFERAITTPCDVSKRNKKARGKNCQNTHKTECN